MGRPGRNRVISVRLKPNALRLFLALILAAGVGLVVVFRERFDAAALESWVTAAGIAGPLAFMGVYLIATVLFVPGSILTLAGGALFGPVFGTLYNLTGATLGATAAFLVSRYIASDWVRHKAGLRMRRILEGVEAEGWRFVAFARLVPAFPFFLLNYALGVTRVRLSHYVVATYLCMLPASAAFSYLGYAGREAVAGGEGLIRKILLALAFLAVVAFLPRFITRLRRGRTLSVAQLDQRRAAGLETLLLDLRTRPGGEDWAADALHLPLDELEARFEELDDHLEQAIAVFGDSPRDTARAARLLVGKGFADVHVLNP